MHPKIEDINKNIVNWIQENFVKTLIPFHVHAEQFKFHRITKITKAWKENDLWGNYWVVDVLIEYSLSSAEKKTLTFQVNNKGEILGFDLHEPMISHEP